MDGPRLPFNEPTRGDQIYARFKKFHRDNPHVWRLFCSFAEKMQGKGYEKYSARTIIERVRWEVDLDTNASDGLKLNDHYSPYYARMFLATHPEAEGFLEIRRRVSEDRAAYDRDVAVFNTGSPGDESRLLDELRRLAGEDDAES